MRKLKLAVFTKEEAYGRALARGLAAESRGLDVRICSSDAEAVSEAEGRVIITDRSEIAAGMKVYLAAEEQIPVREILKLAAEEYYAKRGEVFVPWSGEGVRILRICSKKGGSGATVVALALARALAETEGRRVLYLNLGAADDHAVYVNAPFAKAAAKRRFIYEACVLEKEIFPTKYAVRDEAGVYYLGVESAGNSLAREADLARLSGFLRRSKFFDYVAADSGKVFADGLDEDLRLEVFRAEKTWRLEKTTENSEMRRSAGGEEERRPDSGALETIAVFNFAAAASHVAPGGFRLPYDEDSFIIKKDSAHGGADGDYMIEIAAAGPFAAAVGDLAEAVEERLSGWRSG